MDLLYSAHKKKGTDLNTYPERYVGMYTAAYGVIGYHSNVDSNVYDAHKAFEIDKTKMKMLVSLDLNNQRIINSRLHSFNTWNCIFRSNGNSFFIIYNVAISTKYFIHEGFILFRIVIDLGRNPAGNYRLNFSKPQRNCDYDLIANNINIKNLNLKLESGCEITISKEGGFSHDIEAIIEWKLPLTNV